jgi:hypothetical protein
MLTLDWRARAAFSSVYLVQAISVKMALSPPSRQQVTPAVETVEKVGEYAALG